MKQQQNNFKYVKLNNILKIIRTIVLQIGSNLNNKLNVQTSLQVNISLLTLLCMRIVT